MNFYTTDEAYRAEPAPKAQSNGTRYGGDTTGEAEPVDTDTVAASILEAIGVLSPDEIADVMAKLAKYSAPGASNGNVTNRAGATRGATDARSRDAAMKARERLIAKDAAERRHNASIAQNMKDFWSKHLDGFA